MLTAPSIYEIEAHILDGDTETARSTLRTWLAHQMGQELKGNSVFDLLEHANTNPPPNRDILAAYVLRCVRVDGLLPDGNGRKNIRRVVTSLCERSLPALCDRLKIREKSQTHEKYEILQSAYGWLQTRLEPLTQPYSDLDALLNRQGELLGSFKDKTVNELLKPFDVSGIRGGLDELFSSAELITRYDESISDAVEQFESTLAELKNRTQEHRTFFTEEFLEPLLHSVESAQSTYLQIRRAESSCKIQRLHSSATLPKRYPLHDTEREISIVIPLENEGPGPATKTKISVSEADSSIAVDSLPRDLGTIPKGAFSATIDAMVIEPSERADIIIEVEWCELGAGKAQQASFDFSILAQRADIDWSSLVYEQRYRTDVAEGNRFIGRTEKVRAMAGMLLTDPMTPFYITGQKRVGKTSLIKAVTAFAKEQSANKTIADQYILWGNVAHVEPTQAMRQLGESIEEFIAENTTAPLETGFDYSGSLSNIVTLLRSAHKNSPDTKFVCVIDEFDEIHEELFVSGNLASTFFANLRAISREPNFCLCLVGGENMPFLMERQGQKLNNFVRVDLNYYSRNDEWDDFHQLVAKPTNDLLSWHDEAVSYVFNETNGNPYFANLICSYVFRSAVSDRDADITEGEVKRAINRELSSLGANSFAHLWQDGIAKQADEREPDILRRTRVLVALARCLMSKVPTTPTNIADHRASSALAESEIAPVLHDFLRRGVLIERAGQYLPALPLFGRWLQDAGVSHLVADHLSDEIAGSVIERENAARVQSSEIVALTETWPTYMGRKIGVDEVNAFLSQVNSPIDQRIIFKLLERTRVYSEAHVRERLSNLHTRVHRELPVPVKTKKRERRNDIIVTYVDGPAKSGATYASMYAEENNINSANVFERGSFVKKLGKHIEDSGVTAVVVVDDIVATGKSMSDNIQSLINEAGGLLDGLKVRILALTGTAEGQRKVERSLHEYEEIDIKLFIEELLPEERLAFAESSVGWDSTDQRERAEALCKDLGGYIYRRAPLGFGNRGLLVVFPTTVPNNSLPLLHSKSKKPTERPWKPLFPRPTN